MFKSMCVNQRKIIINGKESIGWGFPLQKDKIKNNLRFPLQKINNNNTINKKIKKNVSP